MLHRVISAFKVIFVEVVCVVSLECVSGDRVSSRFRLDLCILEKEMLQKISFAINPSHASDHFHRVKVRKPLALSTSQILFNSSIQMVATLILCVFRLVLYCPPPCITNIECLFDNWVLLNIPNNRHRWTSSSWKQGS